MTRRVTGFHVDFPDEKWASWKPGNGISVVAAELASACADGVAAQALVRRSVTALNAEAIQKGAVVVHEAIWVPDRSTGEVMAVMDVGIRGFPQRGEVSANVYSNRNVKKEIGRAGKVLDHAVHVSEVSAGPMAVESMVVRLRGERTIQGYLYFLVFPEGLRQAFVLQFNTVHLNLMNEIAAQGRIIAESVTLTVGDAPE